MWLFIVVVLLLEHPTSLHWDWDPTKHHRMSGLVIASHSRSLGDEVNAALELHKAGKLEEALLAYQGLVDLVPPVLQTTLYSNIGAIFNSRGEYDEAVHSFRTALLASPDNAQAHFNLAVTLTSKLGQHSESLKHCRRALLLSPSMLKGLHLMGNILQSLGRHEEALEFFVRAENAALITNALEANESATAKPNYKINWAPVLKNIGQRIEMMVDDVKYNMECVSERPLIFIAKGLMSKDECNHIIKRATPLLGRSEVMGGDERDSTYRSSKNAWLSEDNDNVIRALQHRISALLQVPIDQLHKKFEELQVVNYEVGGQFKMHHDSSSFHQRIMTVLVYLNSIPEGAETFFPFAPATSSENSRFDKINTSVAIEEAWLKLNNGAGLRIKPQTGDALIFGNYILSNLSIDTSAVHAGLPVPNVIEGGEDHPKIRPEKWICNYWIKN